jgi:hypothetical protein
MVWFAILDCPVFLPCGPAGGRCIHNGHFLRSSPRSQNPQQVLTIPDGSALAAVPMVRTTLHKEDKVDTSLLWNRGIQAGVTTVIGRSPRHLPHVTVEEVLEGTRGCGISGSGTTRVRFDMSRAPDQDLRSKESCHKVEDDQVLQDPMEQPYDRRSNTGE